MGQHWGERTARVGNVHFLSDHLRVPNACAPRITVRIDNYQHIRKAYGEEIASLCRDHLRLMLVDYFRDEARIIGGDGGAFTVHVDGSDHAALALTDALSLTACGPLESLFTLATMIGVDTPQGAIHLALSGAWQGLALEVAPASRFHGQPLGDGELWAVRYRADMATAAHLMGCIEGAVMDGLRPRHEPPATLVTVWQAVRDARNANRILYYQANPHLLDPTGKRRDLAADRLALERLGLCCALDYYGLLAALDQLETDPDITIGVPVSAQSMGDAGWWNEVRRRLDFDPSLGSRLVIEITETATFPDISAAANLVRRLQRFGCRIAIDNFGLGFASIRELIALSPDIVRLDPFFLGPSAPGSLLHLAGLAQSLVPAVIASGIVTREQSELATQAGVIWQQGVFFGEASVTRPWRFGECFHALPEARP